MSQRVFVSLIVGLLFGLTAASTLRSKEPTSSDSKSSALNDYTAKDVTGATVSFRDFREKKAVVVVFVGTQCPINNAYMPRLTELSKEYAAKGVQFVAVNANQQDTPKDIAEHARKHQLTIPILKDTGNVLAELLHAKRTPEAFLLNDRRDVRYHGRIDDQFGLDYKRTQPQRRDLAIALDEVLAGKPVSVAETEVAGCLIGRVKRPNATAAVTFSKHVAPLLQKHCQECHRPGQVGPMSLLSYDDAVAWSDMIREVLEARRMPPWYADPRHGSFANDRRLSDADRETLIAWIREGMAKGADKDLPPPKTFTEGWSIGKPDVVFTMPTEFSVPAEMPRLGIPYKEFEVETGFKEDRWIIAAEAKPGAAEVVHHIVVFVVPPGETFFPGNPKTPVLGGTAPGDVALQVSPELRLAKKIPAGSRLVLQMHYTPNGKAQKDRSSIGFVFAKGKPEQEVRTVPIAELGFRIPPNAENHEVESWFRFREDGLILGFMPHMHLRGKDFLCEAIYPDGRRELLLSVPRYNFNWQSVYRLKKPLSVPKGTRVHCVAHFDNSARNPNNPDPTKAVTWGDQTWEEMMIGWMDYAYKRPVK